METEFGKASRESGRVRPSPAESGRVRPSPADADVASPKTRCARFASLKAQKVDEVQSRYASQYVNISNYIGLGGCSRRGHRSQASGVCRSVGHF